jgi:putative oxidoreductase
MKIFLWLLRLIVAGILMQTLYFKFSAHPDSVYIFAQTGLGAFGRIGAGVVELIAAILILIPRYTYLGCAIVLGVMSGAILFHLTKLGIEVKGDDGLLFYLALIVFLSSLILAYFHRYKYLQLFR